MVKLRKKRYGMSGAGRRNEKCDTKDSKFEKISTQVDDDYRLYLASLDSCQESGFEREDSLDHNDANDDDVDPQYKIFLDNTVQKGTSYVTTIEENGLPLVLTYEKEVSSSDQWNDVHGRKVKKTRKGDEGKDLEDLKVKNNVERPYFLRSDMGNCEKSVLEPLNRVSMGRRPIPGKQQKSNNMKKNSEQETSSTGGKEKYLDKDYLLFLQCIQSEGYDLNVLFPDNQNVKYDRDDSGDVEVLDSFTFCNGASFRPCVPSIDYCEVVSPMSHVSPIHPLVVFYVLFLSCRKFY